MQVDKSVSTKDSRLFSLDFMTLATCAFHWKQETGGMMSGHFRNHRSKTVWHMVLTQMP